MKGSAQVRARVRVRRRALWAASMVTRPAPPHPLALTGLVFAAAAWGWVVDSPALPFLAPTGNSTLFQSSTAAVFALLGILFGPWLGALGGLVRDGAGYGAALALHPGEVMRAGLLPWLGRAGVDILEDVVLGLVPGLVAMRIRRLDLLALVAAVTAWLSLPLLVVGDALFSGHARSLLAALTTAVGDWNEPVDPALTVYALLTGAMVTFALARWTTHPWAALALGALFALPALALIALGAHP
ncbi:MAG: hypothetical protein IVW57_03820 [Ktedonobacterales bacterium]|nr:hypothetical protein [Ktedonobacterales bacterium]